MQIADEPNVLVSGDPFSDFWSIPALNMRSISWWHIVTNLEDFALCEIKLVVEFLGSFVEEFPEVDLPEIAFAGRSNVGKSSALNCILVEKAAKYLVRRAVRN